MRSALLLPAVFGLFFPTTAMAMDASFMGWADFSMKMDSSRGGQLHFDQTHLSLITDADVNKAWSVFANVEFEHLPEINEQESRGTIELERAYIQYENPRARLRMGRMVMPFGIRIPTHWVMLTPMLTPPPVEAMGHVQTHYMGVEGRLRLEPGKSKLDFTGMVHNGPETTGTDTVVDGLSGFGADVKWRLASFHTFGTSVSLLNSDAPSTTDQSAWGAYVDLLLPANLGFRAESNLFDFRGDNPHWSHYLLATYALHPYDALSVGYRLSFGTTGADMATSSLMHTSNLSWNPGNGVRLVLEHHTAVANAADHTGMHDGSMDHSAMDHGSMDHGSMEHGASSELGAGSGRVHTGILWLGVAF